MINVEAEATRVGSLCRMAGKRNNNDNNIVADTETVSLCSSRQLPGRMWDMWAKTARIKPTR